jgi:alpha-L-rhamnosidase
VATRYANLHDELKTAFGNKLVGADGTIADSGQTGFALAFNNDLIPAEKRAAATNQFVESVKSRDRHLATGFIGTPVLLPALHKAGRDDVACKLLLQPTSTRAPKTAPHFITSAAELTISVRRLL